MRTRALGIAVLLIVATAAAEPLREGLRMPALALSDQHDAAGSIDSETRCVLFSRDMGGANILRDALADDAQTVLASAGAVVVSDISRMPSLITKLFALPAMRKRPYRMLLDREGRMTADLPSEKGRVTVLRLNALTIEHIEFVDSADTLRTALGHAAGAPSQ